MPTELSERPVPAAPNGAGMSIEIIGGGLAGCEAAWQAASMGVPVVLHEMRPVVRTAVHQTDRLAELVCSNSFRGDKLDNAVGLLKEEMRRLGSLIMREADRVRVPAGAALAVDREQFAEGVTRAIHGHSLITVQRGEVTSVPESAVDRPVIVATGPLTSSALSADIARFAGTRPSRLLRRHQPHRPRRDDRHEQGVPAVEVGQEFQEHGRTSILNQRQRGQGSLRDPCPLLNQQRMRLRAIT